jgi:hypothetical protein
MTRKKNRDSVVVTSLKRQPKFCRRVDQRDALCGGGYRSVCSLQSLRMWCAIAT